MKVSILKRIAAIESKVQKPEAVPSLIMIGYDEGRKQWSISETYTSGNGKNQTFKRKDYFVDRLQQCYFPGEGNPRVIMDTFGSPDPAIHENLFCFDLRELRKDLKPADRGGFYIESITENEGSKPPTAEIAIVAAVL